MNARLPWWRMILSLTMLVIGSFCILWDVFCMGVFVWSLFATDTGELEPLMMAGPIVYLSAAAAACFWIGLRLRRSRPAIYEDSK